MANGESVPGANGIICKGYVWRNALIGVTENNFS